MLAQTVRYEELRMAGHQRTFHKDAPDAMFKAVVE
jgi:hypothetical protein